MKIDTFYLVVVTGTLTMTTTVNSHKPWTAEEDALLLDAIKAGQYYYEIGHRVGRTPFSVKLRIYKLAYKDIQQGTMSAKDACRFYRVSPNGLQEFERTRTLKRERNAKEASHVEAEVTATAVGTVATAATDPASVQVPVELLTEIRDLLFGIHHQLDGGFVVHTQATHVASTATQTAVVSETKTTDTENTDTEEPKETDTYPCFLNFTNIYGIVYLLFILYVYMSQDHDPLGFEPSK